MPNAPALQKDSVIGDATWLRHAYGFPPQSCVCVAVGRLVWAKGYPHLIRAIAKSSNRNLCCIIVGEGSKRRELHALINNLQIHDRVILAGFKPSEQVHRIVKSADLFVMPSLSEGTPISLMEAAMLGSPIVATRAGGIPEILEDNKHARLVEPGNETQLIQAIEYLLKHPRVAEDQAAKAQRHITDHFGTEPQRKATEAAYEKAIEVAGRKKDLSGNEGILS